MVIDRSASVKTPDYNQMRDFLKALARGLQIGVRNKEGDVIGQGAIVTFSEKATIQGTLKASQEPGRFEDVVTAMDGPLKGGRTKTHLGLGLAYSELTKVENGFRQDDPDVTKLLMIITDGEQTRDFSPGFKVVSEAVKPFSAKNIDVHAVGVGLTAQTAINEVKSMVEKAKNARFPQNYNELMQDVDNYIRELCPGTVEV